MRITKLLRASNWVSLNKPLAKKIGVVAAYLFAYLADKGEYHEEREELDADGYFFCTAPDVERDLGLTRREQDSALSTLKTTGLVIYAMRGMPAKRHFKFTEECDAKLAELLEILPESANSASTKRTSKEVQNVQPSKYETYQQGSTKRTTTKTIINKKEEENKVNDKSFTFFEKEKIVEKIVDDFSDFDKEVAQRGLLHLLRIPRRFTKEKIAEKRKQIGSRFFDEIFWGVLTQINAFLDAYPKKMYKDLNLAFSTFLGTKETFLAAQGLNAYWRKTYESDFSSFSDLRKPQKKALEVLSTKLAAAIREKSGQDPTELELVNSVSIFFERLPQKWASPSYFKLETIAENLPQILAEIKKSGGAPSARPQTYQEIDAENKRRAAEAEQERRAQYHKDNKIKQDMLKVVEYLRRGETVPKYLQNSEAYVQFQAEQEQRRNQN